MLSPMDQALVLGISDDDLRARARSLVRFMLNTEPGWRPSDAAHYVVRLHSQGFLVGRCEEHEAAMKEWHAMNGRGRR